MLQLHDTAKDGRLSFDEFKAIFYEEREMNASEIKRNEKGEVEEKLNEFAENGCGKKEEVGSQE